MTGELRVTDVQTNEDLCAALYTFVGVGYHELSWNQFSFDFRIISLLSPLCFSLAILFYKISNFFLFFVIPFDIYTQLENLC